MTHAGAQWVADVRARHLPAGSVVFRQGDGCTALSIVDSGCIRVYARAPNGREVVLYRVQPGELCVLTTSCLLGRKPYPADAVAETDVVVRTLPEARFGALLATSEAFRAFVFENFGSRLSGLVQRIESVMLQPVEVRLIEWLLRACDAQGRVRVTQQRLAEEIGTAREVVSRHLADLQGRSLVSVGRGCIDITDRHRLAQALSVA